METNKFQEMIKNSFYNVKEDINELKNDVNHLKQEILALKEEISKIYTLINGKNLIYEEKSSKTHPIISYANKQTNGQTNKQTLKHSPNTQIDANSLKNLDSLFLKLPKREFLFFLTLYQLEEDQEHPISYLSIANHLKLTEGGARTYSHNLIKKGLPIEKIKLNNKQIILRITPEFRALNLKPRLMDIYSNIDVYQTKLTNI
ncbi:hypothetical protein HYT51_02060 [Candidatus Woesearchaeota archaeon]|nr:hypothetical protein [Candidatus Woesearchaeota archaeon]